MEAKPLALLFDESWYRQQVTHIEGDPFDHFLTVGWRRGCSPHPLFDVSYYLAQLSAPLRDGDDPLSHFMAYGASEGLSPHPLFDTPFYMRRYADALGGLDPLSHYLSEGPPYDPHPLFDTAFYLESHPDVASSGMNALVHYALYGDQSPHVQPHPLFDARVYARCTGLARGVNPLVHFVLRMARVAKHARPAQPECSAIILNLNKSVLTLQSIIAALESDVADELEIIVVDNGSRPDDFAFLADLCPHAVRIIRLSMNRYFGEGNNIGVEASRAQLLLFLNNDAFLQATTLRLLQQALAEHPDAGAVGPKLIFADGRIQEAGGFITSDGTVTQRGKGLTNHPDRYAATEPVDYVSAACLLMRRRDFDRIAGFDLAWDPAYYEDVDLCLKLLLIAKRTYYCGQATVIHIENATATDPSHGLGLNTVVEVNREKFIGRWGDFLDSDRTPRQATIRLPAPLSPYGRPILRRAVLYTPYPLYPGGGERYMLTIAQALSQHYRTTIVTPERYSSYRFRTIAQELDLDLAAIESVPVAEIASVAGCDIFIAMGNQVFPSIRAVGRRRMYICQFPLPMHVNHIGAAWELLGGYDQVIVYSAFCAEHFRERAEAITQSVPPIEVLAPPVPSYASSGPAKREANNILSVGRFTREGHCKRQDTMIAAFRLLIESFGRKNLQLHLVGAVPPDAESREYLRELRDLAHDLPVHFHLNAPPAALRDFYQRASLYWHATGYMVWEKFFPERLEHFGISVVEAMSAGALPLVCANGGPAEIVIDGRTGFHWRSEYELAEKTMFALNL
ncbi:MAG: glycosyltransferase, partial [Acidobacteriaceae bacterium]|nr:glycosyltransferase [Acidobacteriaceae bacterium]